MNAYEVRTGRHFWSTLGALRGKYTLEQYSELENMIKACIRELQKTGSVEEFGWSEHVLRKPPFADGIHIEFHTNDDDVLVVYFRREERRVIRMVGVYDHASLPNS